MVAKTNTQLGGGRYVREGQTFTEAEIKKYQLKETKAKAKKDK